MMVWNSLTWLLLFFWGGGVISPIANCDTEEGNGTLKIISYICITVSF